MGTSSSGAAFVAGPYRRSGTIPFIEESSSLASSSTQHGNTSSPEQAFQIVNNPNGIGSRRVIKHKIKENETLAGIAIYYGVRNLEELKRANKIWHGSDIHHLAYINIPLELCSIADLYARLNSFDSNSGGG